MSDRVPPHDLEAEKAVLGCIMLSGPECLNECQSRFGAAKEAFYDLRHQTIYHAAIALHGEGKPVDEVTLTGRLRDQKTLENVGGLGYILSLGERVASAANLRFYLDTLREKQALREVLRGATMIEQEAWSAGEQEPLDIPDFLGRVERLAMDIRQRTAWTLAETDNAATLRALTDEIENAHNPEWQASRKRLLTGLRDFDALLGEMTPGDVIVVAARPSVGKTSLAMNIAERIAINDGLPVGVFSLEMGAKSLLHRSACTLARVNNQATLRGRLKEDEIPRLTLGMAKLKNAPLQICDKGGLTIAQIAAHARRMAVSSPLSLLVVDYAQLIQSGHSWGKRNDHMTTVSNGIKALAKELNVPVLLLSQLNRDAEREGRRPKLSDLRDSGAIEQDADAVLFLHRPEDEAEKDIQTIEAELAKHRNGPTGRFKLTYFKTFTKFEDFTPPPSVDPDDVPPHWRE